MANNAFSFWNASLTVYSVIYTCFLNLYISPVSMFSVFDVGGRANSRIFPERFVSTTPNFSEQELKILQNEIIKSKAKLSNANDCIQYLVELGLSQKDVLKVLKMYPSMFRLSVEDNLKPTVKYFEMELGLSKPEISKVLKHSPCLLSYNLDENLKPSIEYYETELGFSRQDISKAIQRNPRLLGYRIEGKIKPVIRFLQDELQLSIGEVSKIVTRFPALLGLKIDENLKPTIKFYIEYLGMTSKEVSKIVKKMPQILGCSIENNLKPTVHFFQDELGMTKQEVADLLKVAPQAVGLSIEKNYKPTLQLFHQYDIPTKDAVKHMTWLNISYKKRLSFIEYLESEFQATTSDIQRFMKSRCFSVSLDGRVKNRVELMQRKGVKARLWHFNDICLRTDKSFAAYIQRYQPNFQIETENAIKE